MQRAVPPPTRRAPSLLGIIGFLVFVEFVSGFLQGFYDPLQKLFATHHGVSDADITWFQTIQGLSAAISVPLLAKFGDMFGHRRILRITMVLVTAGALLSALAPTFELLLASRVMMGPLAVWLPLEIAIIHHRLNRDDARRSIGILVSILTIGAIVGTIAGGVATSLVGFTTALFVPVVLLLLACYAVFFRIPASSGGVRTRIDGLGLAGLAVIMVLLLSGMNVLAKSGLADIRAWLLIGASAAVLVPWIVWERRIESPAVNLRLLASRSLAPLYVSGFMFGFVMFGFQTPFITFSASDPSKDGYGLGMPTLTVSLAVAFFTLLTAIGAITFTAASHRMSMKATLVCGAGLAASGFIFFAMVHDAPWTVFAFAIPTGLGMGLLMGALPALIAEYAPDTDTGIAAGVYNSLRTLGGSIAGALFAIILSIALTSNEGTEAGYTIIWSVCAVLFLASTAALAFGKYSLSTSPEFGSTPTGTVPQAPTSITLNEGHTS
ncbi:MFS family permease [Microbacterium natoriense]|uniref:MFS family permease n=1 Tax=Microbacterium natoriense TaxID=284570 RepID=A0AAW8EVE7_9MICO|nr:MFS transporter [Microbacterium natoriense]MDQ0647067.1 MFS family permease [Microbacterium natoriense]